MARYIDADALLDSLMGYKRYISIQYGELEMLECDVVKQCIDSAPAATLPIKDKCAFCPHCTNCDVNDDLSIKQTEDVVERKRGEWIKCSDTPFYWMCSECGTYLFWRKEEYLLREYDDANYCPNCGSDMRKGKKKDDRA